MGLRLFARCKGGVRRWVWFYSVEQIKKIRRAMKAPPNTDRSGLAEAIRDGVSQHLIERARREESPRLNGVLGGRTDLPVQAATARGKTTLQKRRTYTKEQLAKLKDKTPVEPEDIDKLYSRDEVLRLLKTKEKRGKGRGRTLRKIIRDGQPVPGGQDLTLTPELRLVTRGRKRKRLVWAQYFWRTEVDSIVTARAQQAKERASTADTWTYPDNKERTIRSLAYAARRCGIGFSTVYKYATVDCPPLGRLLELVRKPRLGIPDTDVESLKRALARRLARTLPKDTSGRFVSPKPVPAQGDRQVVTGPPAPRRSRAAAAPRLNNRMELALQAMAELRAFDIDHRKTTEQIVERAEGMSGNPESYKQAMARLCRMKLIDRKRGRDGGCWLLSAGRSEAERLREKV